MLLCAREKGVSMTITKLCLYHVAWWYGKCKNANVIDFLNFVFVLFIASGYVSLNALRFLFLTNAFLGKKQSVELP